MGVGTEITVEEICRGLWTGIVQGRRVYVAPHYGRIGWNVLVFEINSRGQNARCAFLDANGKLNGYDDYLFPTAEAATDALSMAALTGWDDSPT